MSDEQWFSEIEVKERGKRRSAGIVAKMSGLARFCTFCKDIRDGFSLPKGAYIKYAH
jgi:hypothetical protein